MRFLQAFDRERLQHAAPSEMMAEKSLYSILNIHRLATKDEVKQAYKDLALKFHPDKNNKPEAEDRFKEIAKAYSVLMDEKQREQYDRSRELRDQFYTYSGGSGPGCKTKYVFFEDGNDDVTEMLSNCDFGQGLKQNSFKEQFFNHMNDFLRPIKKSKTQDPPVEKTLSLSLEEIYTGITKNLSISRKVYNQSGSYSVENKILVVTVTPGKKEGTRFTFSGEGDVHPGVQPADVVITLKDKIHKDFTRDTMNNLKYTCRISLSKALSGGSVDIPTIDGEFIRINHDGIVHPGAHRIIKGEGLPLPNNPLIRADLIIKYNVAFPSHLSSQHRKVLIDNLPK